jgi:hypothetical protein
MLKLLIIKVLSQSQSSQLIILYVDACAEFTPETNNTVNRNTI